MEILYTQITDYMQEAGQRLVELQARGKIKDIGVTKSNVTEEDLRIERALTGLILDTYPDHKIFAEEEHDSFENAENIWVIDPISATRALIEGRPHYASVAAHVQNGKTRFAAVYDPSVGELFTAETGKGAYLNGKLISVSSTTHSVLQNTATSLFDSANAIALRSATKGLDTERNEASFAVNYCLVAASRKDGVISVAKDSFPEFAGALILQEAGGELTNIDGGAVQPGDRLFIGGNRAMHEKLLRLSRAALGLDD
ncbi:MAG: inositol monophosphatase [Candidatus Saccharimonadales bacterium]